MKAKNVSPTLSKEKVLVKRLSSVFKEKFHKKQLKFLKRLENDRAFMYINCIDKKRS